MYQLHIEPYILIEIQKDTRKSCIELIVQNKPSIIRLEFVKKD
jgi:hypothetical protein